MGPHKKEYRYILVLMTLLLVTSLLLQPAGFIRADNDDLPDFSVVDGNIDGLSLPLTDKPRINRNTESYGGFVNFTCSYSDKNEDDAWRELTLSIWYWRDVLARYPEGIPQWLDEDSKYGPGYTGDSGLQWLEEMRQRDGYHEILVENQRSDRFSLLYRYDGSATPWSGQRLVPYRDRYFIFIAAEGRGAKWTEGLFKQDFDVAENYAKAVVDSLIEGKTPDSLPSDKEETPVTGDWLTDEEKAYIAAMQSVISEMRSGVKSIRKELYHDDKVRDFLKHLELNQLISVSELVLASSQLATFQPPDSLKDMEFYHVVLDTLGQQMQAESAYVLGQTRVGWTMLLDQGLGSGGLLQAIQVLHRVNRQNDAIEKFINKAEKDLNKRVDKLVEQRKKGK